MTLAFCALAEVGDRAVLLPLPVLSTAPGWCGRELVTASALETSRWRGEDCFGELDFLESESPLPPRDELRGETLPVCEGRSQ